MRKPSSPRIRRVVALPRPPLLLAELLASVASHQRVRAYRETQSPESSTETEVPNWRAGTGIRFDVTTISSIASCARSSAERAQSGTIKIATKKLRLTDTDKTIPHTDSVAQTRVGAPDKN